ncbi:MULTISPECIES: universal stress protein [unclassified Streptomyces]|uniref:universal stress protein n=1 Tax=unclassified Streptomyces TaxID=2593676 RepID=UPI0038206791
MPGGRTGHGCPIACKGTHPSGQSAEPGAPASVSSDPATRRSRTTRGFPRHRRGPAPPPGGRLPDPRVGPYVAAAPERCDGIHRGSAGNRTKGGGPDGTPAGRGRRRIGIESAGGRPGVGGSADGTGSVRFAAREAEARGCALTAVRAWRNPAHQPGSLVTESGAVGPRLAADAADALGEGATAALDDALRGAAHEHPGLDVGRKAVEGPAHHVLLEASADADLIVVGALRRQGHFGLQLGRVAHALLHHSACPVAVVPRPV